jgi:hypothetical protein
MYGASTVGGSLADEVPSLADFPSTEALAEQPRESQLLPWRNGSQFWGDVEANLVALGPAGGLAAGTVRGTGRLLVGAGKLFDIIPYWRTAAAGFQKHHGLLDAWARANILGYKSGAAPAVVLTIEQHNATRAVFNTWRAERGWARTPIDWTRVSPQETQALTYRMFEAAGVSKDVVTNYFRALNEFLYGF